MLYLLLTPFRDFWGALNVFQYITFRAAGAAITALLLGLLLGRIVIPWLRAAQFGQTIREDGPESHKKKSGTPTMGGLIILGSVLLSTLLWARLDNRFLFYTLGILLGYGALGFVDDWINARRKNTKGVSPRGKLIVQFGVAAAVAAAIIFDPDYSTQFYVPFFKYPLLDLGVLYLPFAALVIVGTSNAVNLTDGLDGLAIGVAMIVLAAYAVFTYATGHIRFAEYLQIPFSPQAGELTVLVAALIGAGLAFLWYNAHPAEVFMGDVGSLALGGLIGTIAVIVKQEILLALIGGIFVAETLSVMIQVAVFKRTRRRVFRMAPLHHHFELAGWAETKVVMRFWIVSIILAIAGLATLKLR
jgi:phospho-N-acetylmuramoyl-pentapeptide-transferase